tara:strand:+ start:696 stop:905 length:210 start_codon:yes stop_codon:yes gene_type:complete
MSEIVKDMIGAIVSDDQIDAEAKFKSALSTKVGQALDDKRKDIAGTILSKPVETKKDDTNAEEPVEIDN